MPTMITNQARLTYTSGGETSSAASNTAATSIPDSLEVNKTSLEAAYRANDEITYVLSAVNNCCCEDTTLTVTDDLGSFVPDGCVNAVTPLTYVGPSLLYIDGAQSDQLGVTADPNRVVFTIPSLPAGSSAIIIYKVRVNEFANIALGSVIENVAQFEYTCNGAKTSTASHVLPVETYADVSIFKHMNKNCDCNGMTYSFIISNSGNEEAYDVELTDEFDPIPEITSITVGGEILPAECYTYTGGVLTIPSANCPNRINVPAAGISYTCGGVEIEPSTIEIVVTGVL